MQKKTKMQKKATNFFKIAKMYMQKKSRKYYFKKTGKKKAEMQKKGCKKRHVLCSPYPLNVAEF